MNNTETELLRTIAAELAARKDADLINEPQADHRLLLEARRLEKAITVALRAIDNLTQRDTFFNDTLTKLIGICDTLFEVRQGVSPDIKALLELLAAVRQVLPGDLSPLLRLPKAFIYLQKEQIGVAWAQQKAILDSYEIDERLVEIAAIPFQRFIDGQQKLYWGDFTWLKGYEAKLKAVDWEHSDCSSKTEALMSLLIGRDFNHEQFYVYCKKYIIGRLASVNTKNRRVQELEICEKLLIEDTQVGLPSFDRYANSITARVLKWIKEETSALKAGKGEAYVGKLSVVWNVEALSVFFKLLWDHKLFKDTTLDLLSKQIAATFSSKTKGDFQAHTVHARFYVTDIGIMKMLEAFLEELLEDIRRFTR